MRFKGPPKPYNSYFKILHIKSLNNFIFIFPKSSNFIQIMLNGSEIIEEAVKTFVSKAIEKTFEVVSDKFKNKSKNKIEERDDVFEKYLTQHINELYNWSNTIEFIGLGKPIYTNLTTDLKYYYSSMGYSRNKHDELISEDDLLKEKEHIYLLGDPGSGKTTTLKRIIISRFFTDDYHELPYRFPILVRFRAIAIGHDLYSYIASILGINYDSKTEPYDVLVNKIVNEEIEVIDGYGQRIRKIIPVNVTNFEQSERIVHYFQGVKLQNYITDLIEENRILLIMDGFDEINPLIAETIENQIKEISLKLFHSRIILTTRPNYIKNAIPGSSVLYIRELLPEQIESISKLWLKDYSDFIEQLNAKSYKELTNRPLFLCFLILLYNEGYLGVRKQLPKFSKDVYHSILELLIIKWDAGRDIHRQSIYGLYFEQRKKLEFLANLAFELTYVVNEKVFSHATFRNAYISIHELFDLPKNEAEIVAEELENHTGIIIKTLYDRYEFSHIALQEYLCAMYIVNAKLNNRFVELLKINPVPFALVVCLSSDPVSWFCSIVKNISELYGLEYKSNIATIILSRLLGEAPNFKTQCELGIAFLKISTDSDCNDTNFVSVFERLIKHNAAVLNSIKMCLDQYNPIGEKLSSNNQLMFTRKGPSMGNFFPSTFAIPISTYEIIWE